MTTDMHADWTALRQAVDGELALPGTPAYEAAHRPPLARFHAIRPRAIVRCATDSDVVAAIAFATRRELPLAVRAGGHCFAGRSSTDGLLIDLRPMRAVSVGRGVVHAGAGTRLGELYEALEPRGLAVAAGCGRTVGVAGLVLGGGLGILGRRHGLTSDQLVSARVVLADGRVLDCAEDQHEDLFWALRGAGGCRFGVVTALALRTHPAPATTAVHMQWPYDDAAAVADAWQHWAPDASDDLAASLLVTAGPEPRTAPVAHVFGTLLGTETEARRLLEDLVVGVGARPASASLRHLTFHEAKRHLATHGPGEDLPADAHGYAKSEYFRRPLPRTAVAELIDHLAADRVPGEARTLDFTPWGGAYNRVAEDATAFAHRGERFLLKHDVAVAATDAHQRALDWLRRSWALAHPWGSGRVYPNFPDPELDDWGPAYHGGNAERLARVKAAYDPGNVFGPGRPGGEAGERQLRQGRGAGTPAGGD